MSIEWSIGSLLGDYAIPVLWEEKGSPRLLREAGYSYEVAYTEDPSEPELSSIKFDDIHSGFTKTKLASLRLYKHQVEALEALRSGKNLVMVSGTGSGKTEAWFSYVADSARRREKLHVLAVYPTLALSWDQVSRLRQYCSALGLGLVGVDSLAKRKASSLRAAAREATLVVTNPAMLLYELKKHLAKPGSAVLSPLIENLDLLVIDELDFYDSRSLALILGIVELLAYLRRSIQVAVLSATLANPDELAGFLEKVTSRATKIVRGRPFRVANIAYIVVGKNIESIRTKLEQLAEKVGAPKELLDIISNSELFRNEVYKVVAYFEANDIVVPSVTLDPVEIISWYARGDVEPRGVTLVFTRSINEAERLSRQLRERLEPRYAEKIAVHHHLVPKEERKAVEEGARRGDINVVITPRTLSQGIDIGTVVRIVHYGLPASNREYVQREGRKGRRKDIEFTETIIIPRGRWDRELLYRGIEALKKWLNLPLEKTEVNPDNHYKALLTGSAKIISPILRGAKLDKLEEEALRVAGVLTKKGIDHESLQKLWNNLGFYEYGPPYGVKRVLIRGNSTVELEEIGRCDLVEKFQPGAIDYSWDAIVTKLETAGRSKLYVYRVVEEDIRQLISERKLPWLMEALEEYRAIKTRWGEPPSFFSDLSRGHILSEAETIVYPPKQGFGLLRKLPHRTVWFLHKSRPRVVSRGGKLHVYRESALIPVIGPVAGMYRDYTYGLVVEFQEEAPEIVRLGLATLNLLLRRIERLPLGMLKYSVYTVGEKKLLEVHEESAAGILEKLDWVKLAREARRYKPDEIDEVLLLSLDEYAYATWAGLGFNWDTALESAARVAELISATQVLEISIAGRKIKAPRPSPALGVVSLSILSHIVEVEAISIPYMLAAVAIYDGSEPLSVVSLYPSPLPRSPPPQELRSVEIVAEDLVLYRDAKLVAFDRDIELKEAKRSGLLRLQHLLGGATSLRRILAEKGYGDLRSPSQLFQLVEVEHGLDLEQPDLYKVVANLPPRLEKPRLPAKLEKSLKDYVENTAKLVYLAYTALEK